MRPPAGYATLRSFEPGALDELDIKSELKLKCEINLSIWQEAVCAAKKKPRAVGRGVWVEFRSADRQGRQRPGSDLVGLGGGHAHHAQHGLRKEFISMVLRLGRQDQMQRG